MSYRSFFFGTLAFALTTPVFAVQLINSTGQNISIKHAVHEDHDGYQVTIDGLPSLTKELYETFAAWGGTHEAYLELANKLPVVYGEPSTIEFQESNLCKGMTKIAGIQATVSDDSGSYILCFANDQARTRGEFYLSTDLRE